MSTIIAAAGTEDAAGRLSAGGADRIVAYHSSFYRSRGLPSVAGLLPWGSANRQMLELLPSVLAGAQGTPVLATVCANDGLLPRAETLGRAAAAGAVGVLNAPTVGLLEGTVRAVLEAEGLGRESETALIAEARAAGLEGWAYVFDADWVHEALAAGATGLIVHLGITGHPSPVDLPSCLAAAADAAGAGVPVLLHGGDLGSPANLIRVAGALPAALGSVIGGYMGASVFERSRDVGRTVREWRDALAGTTD